MKLFYEVKDNKYYNIKDVLKNHFEMSDRLIAKLKRNKQIYLNDKSVYITEKVTIRDKIKVDLDFDEQSDNIVEVDIPIKILYEDECILAIDKPPFMPVHPSNNHYNDTLSNAVQFYYKSKNIKAKIHPVNRLDKDTSGIVLFAKNQYIQESLIKQMKQNVCQKEYTAILDGLIEKDNFTVSASISRKQNSIIEREINNNGDISITHFSVIKRLKNMTIVNCILETGRTHQIRVHSKYIGHPIVGDTLYGNKSNLINRQALHCSKLEFVHPISKKEIIIKSKLFQDLKKLL